MNNINESFKRLNKAISQCNEAIKKAFTEISQPSKNIKRWQPNRRVSYNAKYWKIVDDHKFMIDLMVSDFGSNEYCYYSKMDR